jgi:serine/threonine protein kinase
MDATTEFFQEAGLLCSLRHPNIVSCLGVCAQEPNLAIVMELMSGNLTQLIQSGPIPLKVYLPLAIGIARGIAFLHQRSPKVIHRDLKPENILLDANGVPKLGDFGVSKESLITMTQTKIGTPSFAAPELLNSEAYGTAADIYSMSMVMYCMATGVSPFGNLGKEGPAKPFTPLQIMMKVAIQRERPIIPASVNPVLSQLIKDCWDHFPKKRPTATELLSRLVQLEESLNSGPYSSFADSSSSSTSSIASDATIPLTATVALEEPAPKMSRARAKVKTPASTTTLDTATANMSSYTSTRTLRSRTRSQAAAASSGAGGSTTLQLELPEISLTKGRKRKAPGSTVQIKKFDETDEDWAQSDAHKQLVYQLETEETKRRWAEQ